MFALEISFQDGVSQTETIFVRRPQALVGGADSAHVVIEDMNSLPYQLRLVRDLGRNFRVSKVASGSGTVDGGESMYTNDAHLDLGPVTLHITALDSDLLVRDTEPPDRAGVRILRHVSQQRAPLFPAILVMGATPMVISFDRGQPIYIGRAKQCQLRLDSADVSAQHARIGYDNGDFWIEDLGSTNGTYVNQQQISGRVALQSVTPVIIGREVTIMGVTSEDQIRRHELSTSAVMKGRPQLEKNFPVLVSMSEVARPARLVVQPGATLSIGRDPSSDMWLGAPHVSRLHCAVSLGGNDGEVVVVDRSTNGTAYEGGILQKGDSLAVAGTPRVLDFGGGITVAICFNEEEEERFATSNGSLIAFGSSPRPASDPSPMERIATGAPVLEGGEGEREGSEGPGFLALIIHTFNSVGLNWKIFMVVSALALVLSLVVLVTLLLPLVR